MQFNLFLHDILKGLRKPIRVLTILLSTGGARRSDTGSAVRVTHSVRPSVPWQVVGFGVQENDAQEDEEEGGRKKQRGDGGEEEEAGRSAYGEVSRLTFLQPSARMAGAVAIMDIPAFTRDLPLFPYHKILE